MFLTKKALRSLSLGTLIALFSGLSAAPVAAQSRCAVNKQRAQQLVHRYNQYKAERAQIVRKYNAMKGWCDRNWRQSHTPRYRNYRGQMKSMKIRYNWVKHYQNQIRAEYYGRTGGGYIINGGSTGSTRSTTGGVRLLNRTPGNRRPTVPPRSTGRTGTTSRTPNYGGLNLLNQRAQRVQSRR